MNQQVFFVIGAPRSGTTMLQLALTRHSQIVSPPETAYFTLLCRSRRGQLRHWEWIEKVLGVYLEPPNRRIRTGSDARGHFCRIAEAYVAKSGKAGVTHFVEKTPEHQRRIPRILRTFPEARFILIYRDGRDVALSLAKVPWMSKNLYVNFFLWLHYYQIHRNLLRREPHRVLCVRYEDLVRDPVAEMRLVLDFLGLDYQAQVAEGSGNRDAVPDFELAYKGCALDPISPERVGRWRHELSQTQIARLEKWGGWALRELGYESATNGRRFLPSWHLPVVYARVAGVMIARTIRRKCDDVFGTSLYRPNRMARDLPLPQTASRSNVPSCAEHQVTITKTMSES